MNYKDNYIKKVQENLKKVNDEIDSKGMNLKISNWANKFGYSFEEIKNKVYNDEIFRCVFIKDPTRQNVHKNLASKCIKSLEIVKNFKKLPADGKNAIYLVDGNILKGNLPKEELKNTKSISFMWNCNDLTFYAYHKYTEVSGGVQGKQYSQIQDFLRNAKDFNKKNTILLAICDGCYYLEKDSNTKKTRIETLENLTDNKTSFVLNIEELKDFLTSLVLK